MRSLKSLYRGFRKGMNEFGHNLALIINSAGLFIVYIFGVGITSMIAKLAKKSFLDKDTCKKCDTYWVDYDLKKKPIDEYYRQF